MLDYKNKEYTAFRLTTQSQVCPKLLSFGSFFRRQHFSYPYWTDFAYRSSLYVASQPHREARDLAPGRFPSTHLTGYCLSILVECDRIELLGNHPT